MIIKVMISSVKYRSPFGNWVPQSDGIRKIRNDKTLIIDKHADTAGRSGKMGYIRTKSRRAMGRLPGNVVL